MPIFSFSQKAEPTICAKSVKQFRKRQLFKQKNALSIKWILLNFRAKMYIVVLSYMRVVYGWELKIVWTKLVFLSADQVIYKKLKHSHFHWRQQAWSPLKKSGHCSAVCINVCHNIWALLNPHRLPRDKRLCILLSSPSSHALLHYFPVISSGPWNWAAQQKPKNIQ